MKCQNEYKYNQILSSNKNPKPNKNHHNLRADCKNCFGLCCVALYFSASEGFPRDKEAGQPCIYLQTDFRCRVHQSLREKGLTGCMTFDCFGSGQKVAQITFDRKNWRKDQESTKQMFKVFLIMRQLHELLWYLTEALTLHPARPIHNGLRFMLKETEGLTHLNSNKLIELDVDTHRANVNTLLLKTSELVRAEVRRSHKPHAKPYRSIGARANLIGADLRRFDLRGANLRGACLIAADLRGCDLSGVDFIGADFRDADLRGANLTKSIFLTQAQVNAAKGDTSTELPLTIARPSYWV